ncbi:unnamed protein product [Nesidiocoris tenuis]|uniref:C2 domain-containing protein n=1 Tax=Nesidiocoris tenuis TaxID=355587 RepID=A0A6H5HBF5_9HEMI|nr:unnamed protein product [Nesidiocoris tenuis]
MLSKSDPMVVTFLKPFGQDKWVEYHRTEVVTNSHDPDFLSKPHLEYHFEEHQQLKFEVYDLDSSSTNLADHDFLGFATCSLGQIITGGKVVNRTAVGNLTILSGDKSHSESQLEGVPDIGEGILQRRLRPVDQSSVLRLEPKRQSRYDRRILHDAARHARSVNIERIHAHSS